MPEFTIELKSKTLSFHTNNKVFSPSSLDRGTAAMLSTVDFMPDDRILDLGCGYGIVGILAATCLSPNQVTMCDISEDAVQLSMENARRNGVSDGLLVLQSNGFDKISETNFTKILSNPPYHTDFSVAKAFIEDGWRNLAAGGMMYMVTKRKEWYKNKLIAVFGGVHIEEIDGYFVFSAKKISAKKNSAQKISAQKNLSAKEEISLQKKTDKKRESASKQNLPATHLSKKLSRKQRRAKHSIMHSQ